MSRDKSHTKLVSFWKDSVNYPAPSLSKSEEYFSGNLSNSTTEDLSSSQVVFLEFSITFHQSLEGNEEDELANKETDTSETTLRTFMYSFILT